MAELVGAQHQHDGDGKRQAFVDIQRRGERVDAVHHGAGEHSGQESGDGQHDVNPDPVFLSRPDDEHELAETVLDPDGLAFPGKVRVQLPVEDVGLDQRLAV